MSDVKDNQQESNLSAEIPDLSSGLPPNNLEQKTNEPDGVSNEFPGETNSEHTVSARRIEANRQNAKRSTGPRTARGKKTVSTNAVQHGFFAKSLLIQHRDGQECPAEYGALYSEVHEHYKPVGWVEERLVEQIVFMSWRQRRVVRWESGMISKALAEHDYYRQQSTADDQEGVEFTPMIDPRVAALTDHLLLPSKEDLDILLRYEAMIHRQLNHAIGELERLQTRRKEGLTLARVGNIAKQSQEVI